MDTHELAWASGFFDGEGHLSGISEKAVRRPRTAICVSQIETTSLYRLQRAFGFGVVYGPYKRRPPHNDVYQFVIRDFEHSQAAVAMMWPWLGEPKRQQAIGVFRRVKDYMAQRRFTQERSLLRCPRGHDKTRDPIVVGKSYGMHKKCSQCVNDIHRANPSKYAANSRAFRARRKAERLVKSEGTLWEA
jgi:rRNA maturation protein Nop10